MKRIRISFTDFWQGFDIENNYFIETLRKFYIVEVVDEKEKTEYLFFSCFGHQHLEYHCIKIFYTGENIVPDFNLCDYAIGFNDIYFDDRYIRIPLYVVDYRQDWKRMFEIRKQGIQPRVKFCAFVASNNINAATERKEIFDKLSEYKKVDSGGRYLNNIGIPNGIEDKQQFQEQYKFSITFENSSQRGYCTEKIVQGFAAGTIPIYWGDPMVGEYFNEKAFINCHQFSDFDEVLKRVKEIDQDDDLYNNMLQEPVITKKQYTLSSYDIMFEKWIKNIIDNDYNAAFRIPHYGKELEYQKQLQQWLFYEKKYSYFDKKSRIKKMFSVLKGMK